MFWLLYLVCWYMVIAIVWFIYLKYRVTPKEIGKLLGDPRVIPSISVVAKAEAEQALLVAQLQKNEEPALIDQDTE